MRFASSNAVRVLADLDREVDEGTLAVAEVRTALVPLALQVCDLVRLHAQHLGDPLVLDHAVLALVALGRLEDQELLGQPVEFAVLQDRHDQVGEDGAVLRVMAEHLEDVEQRLETLLGSVVERQGRGVGLVALDSGYSHGMPPLFLTLRSKLGEKIFNPTAPRPESRSP
jgi:hypothetical protein